MGNELIFREIMKDRFESGKCGFLNCEIDPIVCLKVTCNDPNCGFKDEEHYSNACAWHYLKLPETAYNEVLVLKEDAMKDVEALKKLMDFLEELI
jgi:hypothetical protein